MTTDMIKFQVSAPGKIILFGEHSVVHKRTAIATTINKRTTLKFIETNNHLIEIKMPGIGLECSFNMDQIKSILKKSVPMTIGIFSLMEPKRISHNMYLDDICLDISSLCVQPLTVEQMSAIKGFLYLLRGMLGSVELSLNGFIIEMSSELAIGEGMGSSASFSVCLASAFLHYICRYFKLHHTGLVNVCKNGVEPYVLDLEEPLGKFTNQDKQLINSWAYSVEKIMHGSPSGIDNTICTFGSLIEMYRSAAQVKENPFNIMPYCPQLRILLVDTGVSRVTANLVCKVATLKSNHPQIVEHILDAMGETARKASDTLQQLCVHSTSQKWRAKFQVLGELIDLNQGLLKTLGVSHPHLDTICELSIKYGLHSKLTGAGGGGYAYTLVPPEFDELQITEYCDELRSVGLHVIDVTLGSPGVMIEP